MSLAIIDFDHCSVIDLENYTRGNDTAGLAYNRMIVHNKLVSLLGNDSFTFAQYVPALWPVTRRAGQLGRPGRPWMLTHPETSLTLPAICQPCTKKMCITLSDPQYNRRMSRIEFWPKDVRER